MATAHLVKQWSDEHGKHYHFHLSQPLGIGRKADYVGVSIHYGLVNSVTTDSTWSEVWAHVDSFEVDGGLPLERALQRLGYTWDEAPRKEAKPTTIKGHFVFDDTPVWGK